MSRLDSVIRRLQAQRSCIDHAIGLIDGQLEVGRVDFHQHVALLHGFIVADVQPDDAPGHFRRHRDDVGAYGGVARPGRLHIGVPSRPAEETGKRDDGQRDQERRHPWAASGVDARFGRE